MRAIFAIVTAACLTASLPARGAAATDGAEAAAKNIMPNASFEAAEQGKPAAWRSDTWSGRGIWQYAEIGRTGRRSVAISSNAGADVSWTARVPVEPFSTYRLSGWIKTDGVEPGTGRGALLNIHNLQPVATPAVSGTRDWTRVEVVFETEAADELQVNCLLGGWGHAKGTAWYDDLELAQVSTTPAVEGIVIDAAARGEPISKYVYGQFIEHLGRCIYDGIWAEMLEDRKFYYPITADYRPYKPDDKSPIPVVAASPWQITGAADTVTMVKEEPFVGEHTPRVKAGGGIRQNDLGLAAGRKYTGYAWLKPLTGGVKVSATLLWGEEPDSRQTVTLTPRAGEYARQTFEFIAGGATERGSLELGVAGGDCLIGTVSLMPADNVHGMRADTLALLKELDSPIYRWPGGNFVSGYDWRDGIGPRDQRPPRKNPAWTGVEHNDFGIDEYMVFCREIGTEPLVVVNTGLGNADEAVAELQYANAAADTKMGRLRAENGHAEPYGVKYWGIGNEMYGDWQLGHMPLADYIAKHNRFVDAMRAVDDSIKVVAVGAVGPWSEGMMQHAAGHMDLVSEHFYCSEKPDLWAHVRQMPTQVRHKAEAHRRYREQYDSLKGKDIRIALDEWNYWYGPHVFGELGTRYFLKDGLGVAAGLHEYARQSDIMFMANYAQTVNVIGAIKTTKTAAAQETTGLVLSLYRKRFGTVPVKTECAAPVDAMAAWSADGKTLTVGVVNASEAPRELPLAISGAKLAGGGRVWRMADDDPLAYNQPGEPLKLEFKEEPVTGVDKLRVPAISISLFELPTE